jgi:[ribosomal protein S5]-alanine N-acetyltransferase
VSGVRLSGPTLELREFTYADEEALHSIVSDPAATSYTPWGPNEPAETRAFLATAVAQADTPEARVGYHLAVVEQDSGRLVGSVTLDIESAEHARARVGFILGPESWGRGYASEALGMVVDLAESGLRTHRLVAYCHPDNAACARVLEKHGFAQEGRMRDFQRVDDEWRDCLLYARVAGG